MKKFNLFTLSTLLLATLLLSSITLSSCSSDDGVPRELKPNAEQVTTGKNGTKLKGFFLINEGGFGKNKATMDYFDYQSGVYVRDIFPAINPTIAHNLGDVGNDIQIHNNKLYAVINNSNLIEVMELSSGKHLASIDVTLGRHIVFDDKFGYVSSFHGPTVEGGSEILGTIVKIDTQTHAVLAKCTVGFQPEEMVITGGKLYVANSGGYTPASYDNTVSIVDLTSFSEIEKVVVGLNLHRMQLDSKGDIYISSRGDYGDIPSKTYLLNIATKQVTETTSPIPNSCMATFEDKLYVCSVSWNLATSSNEVKYALYNTVSKSLISDGFISDGTESAIKVPYGVAINSESKEILVTDAKDYIIPGSVYCFSADGTLKWSVRAGDIPSRIVFTKERLKDIDRLIHEDKQIEKI